MAHSKKSSKSFDKLYQELKQLLGSDSIALELLDKLQLRAKQLGHYRPNDAAAENMELNFDEAAVSSNSKKLEIPLEVIQAEGVAIFTDGACRGNPGPGAWAALAQDYSGRILFEATGVDCPTTNNRMELEGVIQGLQQVKKILEEQQKDLKLTPIKLYSDSQYVVNGLNNWVHNWKLKGWKTANNKSPENLEQWMALDALRADFKNIEFIWVKGHAGHPQNEYCDQLANKALDQSGF